MGSEKGGDVELRACPFCGAVPDATEETFPTDQGTKWGRVECWCGARGPEVLTGYAPWTEWKAAAIAAWNTRAALQDVQTGDEETEIEGWAVYDSLDERHIDFIQGERPASDGIRARVPATLILRRLSAPVRGGRE